MDNVGRTVISQYANSPVLLSLIDLANQTLDPKVNFNAFYKLIWNVDTAVGIGLDIWGRIVGVGRVLNVPVGGKFFGFSEATNVSADPFNQSPFYSGSSVTSNYALSDDAFRVLIFAKALANISDGSTLSLNRIVTALFPGRGNAYVQDNNDMTMAYIFRFNLTPVESAIIGQSGVMPKPAGVAITSTYIPPVTPPTPPAIGAWTQTAHMPIGAISTSSAVPFGATLVTPASNVLDWTFGSASPGVTIPDRATLDRQTYYRDLFGDLTNPLSTPGDGTPANWEARYRDYPAFLSDGITRDPRDLHPVFTDHLELVARTFADKSSPLISATVISPSTGTAVNIATANISALTTYAPGYGVGSPKISDAPTVTAIVDATHLTLSSPQNLAAGDVLTFGPAVEMGYLRLPISFVPGMYAEINCQWPTSRWSWPTFWMFSGEEQYGTVNRRYGTPSLEIDVFDGFPMDNSLPGISLASGAPIYAADTVYGSPYDIYLASGPEYTSNFGSTGGAGVARFSPDAAHVATGGYHRYAIDWRDANTILFLYDGIVIRKRHVTYSAVYSNTSNYDGTPPPVALNGQLVPMFLMASHQFGCRFNPQDLAALHLNTTPIRSPYSIKSIRVWNSTSTADAPTASATPAALPAPQSGAALGDLPALTTGTYTLNIDASQPSPVSDQIGGNAVRLTANAFVDPTQVNGRATIRMQTDGLISIVGPAVGRAQGAGLFTLFLVMQQRNPYGPNPQVLAQFTRATPRSDSDHDKITLAMSSFVSGGALSGFDAKGVNYGAFIQTTGGAIVTAQIDTNNFGKAELVTLVKAVGSDGTVTIGQGYANDFAPPIASGGVPATALAGFTEMTIGGGRSIDGLLVNGANISFCQAVMVGNAAGTVLSAGDKATVQSYLQTKWATNSAVVTPPAFVRQSSNLPNLLYMLDAAQPVQTAALTAGVAAIQVDASNNLLAIIDPVSFVSVVRGYGALGYVASGGVNNKPYFHGTTASVNTAYDGFVFPLSAAAPLFTPLGEAWTIIMVMRQTGTGATALLDYQAPSGHVGIYGASGATDGILRLEQNNGAATVTEPVSAASALNQWQIVTFTSDGQTLNLYRNGALAIQTAVGTIGGLTGPTKFEFLNNPQADVCFIEVANACPSISLHNSELVRLGALYGITVQTATAGPAATIPPIPVDNTLAWLTTPNFPASDQLPTETTPSLHNGLVLAAGAVSLAAVTFTPGGTTDTRAKLDAQFYYNPFTGNQNNVTGNDGIEGVTSCYARVRRYAPGSPYDLHTFSAAGLSLNAVASKNNTAAGIVGGQVWGGMIRAPTFILPGMVISVTYQLPTSVRGWVPVWLFMGGQKTPGSANDPYRGFGTSASLIINVDDTNQYYEYDLNDGFARDGDGVAMGKQLDTSYVNQKTGSFVTQPYDVYTANGPFFKAHKTAGPPYNEILDPATNLSTAMHTLVMNWRNDGTHIVDMLLDGHLYKQQYWEYNTATFTDAGGAVFQRPMHLLINNQAIANFLNPPDLQNMQPNDGTATPGGAWSATIQEIKIIRGNITAASLAAAQTDVAG